MRTGKYVQLPSLLPFVLLIGGTSDAIIEKETITINKCCPRHQELNSELNCINSTNIPKETANSSLKVFFLDYNKISEENESDLDRYLPWLPFTSLVSFVTLEKLTDFELIRDLLKEVDVKYGEQPKCRSEERECALLRPKHSEQFYLFLYPERDIKLYVSKKSSHHFKDEGCGFFKIDRDENNLKQKENSFGKLLLNRREMRTFPLDDFCLDKGPGESFLAMYCPCASVTCIRKCCGEKEMYDGGMKKCVPNQILDDWRPPLENGNFTGDYYLLSNRLPTVCSNPRWLKLPQVTQPNLQLCGTAPNQTYKNKFYFLPDGSLKVEKYRMEIPVQSYCGDHVIYDSETLLENNFLICLDEGYTLPKFRIYGILLIIGGIVLLVTVAISLYLPELKASVYNKVIICHNVSLMLASLIWGSVYLLPRVSRTLCVFSSLAIQCTFLGSFFWMNIMCLDISIGIRRLRATGKTTDEKHKFLWYLVYGCGAPAIITCITAIMEFAPSLPSQYIRPGFGCSYCGFNPESLSILVYIYGPMIAIIALNLICFIMTVVQIMKVQKETAILENQSTSAKTIRNGKKRLVVFSKLFLLMGLTWVMEIVGWIVGGQDYYWYFPDFVNIFRAVFIFLIIVCRKKILRSLMVKMKIISKNELQISRKSKTFD